MTHTSRLTALLLGTTLGCGLIAPHGRDGLDPQADEDVPAPAASEPATIPPARWILTTSSAAHGSLQTLRAHQAREGAWHTTVLTDTLRSHFEWSPTGSGVVYETTEGPMTVFWLRSASGTGWSLPRVIDLLLTETRERSPVWMSPTWSPRGDRLVLQRGVPVGFDLRLHTLTGGGDRLPVESFAGWTRDGTAIGVDVDEGIGLYTMPTDPALPGTLTPIVLPGGTPGRWATGAWHRLGFSADGRFTFVDTEDCADCQDNKLYVASIDGAGGIHEVSWQSASVTDRRFELVNPPSWSPHDALLSFDVLDVTRLETDGARFVTSYVHDAVSGRTVAVDASEEKHWPAFWLPGPRPRLWSSWRRQLLDVTDLEHPVRTALPAGYDDTTFSPDGRWAVERAKDDARCRWSLVDLDELPPRPHDFVTTACEAQVSWSSDGEEAIFVRYGDGTRSTGVLALASGAFAWSSEHVPGMAEPWDTAAYEPGGRRWLERGAGGIVVHDGAARSLLPGGPDQIPAWQP